ncbi:hypothetical protein SAMD00019534_111360 [Acytostelium subglobosum LB1]|uniref:hypothetical protein n=1 Tax=Acytostelium subglobosum LB1 TaxID=1410327 RepID=UPI000645033F|nr:hypothetical protein SAMD00019534_111360 [Acytostelium subglobosum LB1]GAM27960.1 hypothetical protein SAMD00019534_111360 [Acytostelium subglobosum LB1]|eukprot:XP_012749243.1 hypothetical protein SAMD00019534_111360 [Acytostelium subglobosum LB1]
MKSFALLNDKPAAGDVREALCCPTMDLLALLTMSGAIVVHRFLNWQRLLTIGASSAVDGNDDIATSIQWSPNGKRLAVGYASGLISLVSIENGKEIHYTRAAPVSPVTKMFWVQYNPSSSSSSHFSQCFDASPFFPAFAHYIQDKEDEMKPFPQDLDALDVLIAVSKSGVISFLGFGMTLIGTLDIQQILLNKYGASHFLIKSAKSVDIQNVAMSRDFGRAMLTAETDSGLALMLDVDTSILSRKASEIFDFATKSVTASWLLDTLSYLLTHEVVDKWSDTHSQLVTKWSSFGRTLLDFGYDQTHTLEQHLTDMLMIGVPSDALAQYLANGINVKSLRSSLRTLDGLRDTLIGRILAAFTHLMHTLAALRSLSLWQERFGDMLNADKYERLLRQSGAFGVRLESLDRVFGGVSAQYSSFFTWLLKIQDQINDTPSQQPSSSLQNDERAILELLHGGLNQDPLSVASSPSHCDTHSILMQLLDLASDNTIVSQFKINAVTPLGLFDRKQLLQLEQEQGQGSAQRFCSAFTSESHNKFVVAFLLPGSSKLFVGIKERADWRFGCVQLGERDRLDDMVFYDNTLLAVLSIPEEVTPQGAKPKESSCLKQYSYTELDFMQLGVAIPPSTVMIDLLDGFFFQEETQGDKSRLLTPDAPTRCSAKRLWLSIERNVACIAMGSRRTMVFDLVEDEEEEGDDQDNDDQAIEE